MPVRPAKAEAAVRRRGRARDGPAAGGGGVLRTNVALQGGGSHGAFAWGVLDRLLEVDEIEIPAIVGTSAGAVNAVLLAAGLASGGPRGARDLLRAFWTRLSERHGVQLSWRGGQGPFDGESRLPFPAFWALPQTFGWLALEMWSRLVSPYQFNPLDLNPLRAVLRELVDFEAVRRGRTKLFLCATNVLTGKLRIFDQQEIGPDHVLASACLPTLFQAVRIGDDHYWDGGFMGNPPIFPLIYHTCCPDVLIVQINPIGIERVPRSPQEIADRINTLSFNSSLQRELRVISFVSRLVEEGVLDDARFRRLNIHVVHAEEVMRGLSAHSKFDTDPRFLASLHATGREQMAAWLAAHRDKVGRESSVDVAAAFL